MNHDSLAPPTIIPPQTSHHHHFHPEGSSSTQTRSSPATATGSSNLSAAAAAAAAAAYQAHSLFAHTNPSFLNSSLPFYPYHPHPHHSMAAAFTSGAYPVGSGTAAAFPNAESFFQTNSMFTITIITISKQ
ncbi:hypothetical protein BLA29_013106 [Euroglyphus maynei]|uniref:Uncharacterized protein n=1 Tax=Euroglyphus maynei TaxID=6958 RepID=A0A1Y3ARX8_EURMA|nr:hypothetical protein BLA29_013106 [Euroglyphus maynei]